MKIATNVASVVEDGSCISFGIGPLYEALGQTWRRKSIWAFIRRFLRTP